MKQYNEIECNILYVIHASLFLVDVFHNPRASQLQKSFQNKLGIRSCTIPWKGNFCNP